jgi:iron complex outermembrane recepter protein
MRASSQWSWSVRAWLVVGAICALPCAVLAQSQSSSSAPSSSDQANGAALEEIIVTARKKSERLIDVPAAITAIDDETLTRYSDTDFTAVGDLIPDVKFTRQPSGNGGSIDIRGVAANTSADDGVEQAVSVYIDGVSTSRGRVLENGLFDLNDVQVLKGPQALYFGKNSPGGVIVVDSKGPTDQLEGYTKAGYEFTAQQFEGESAFGGPINDTLGFRVAVAGSDMFGGYVHNIAPPISAANDPITFDQIIGVGIPGGAFSWGPQSKQVAGRLTLVYTPNSNFDTTFKFLGASYRDNGDQSGSVQMHCPVGANHAVIQDLSAIITTGAPAYLTDPNSYCAGGKWNNDIGQLPAPYLAGFPFNGPRSAYDQDTSYISSLTMNYRLPVLTLTSVSSYYHYNNVDTTFSDESEFSLAGGANDSNFTQIGEELRAVTAFNGPVNLTSGLYYEHDSRTDNTWSDILRFIDPASGDSVNAVGHMPNTGHTYSAFAELNWKILPNLELAGGARWSEEQKSGSVGNVYIQPGLFPFLGAARPATLPPIDVSFVEHNTSPQATLTWHPTHDVMLYGGYRTGFLAGTISNPGLISPGVTAQNLTVQPEKAKGFEVGVKMQSPDRKLSADLTVYDYIYDNLQLTAFDSATFTVVSGNANATVRGAEASANYQVIQPFAVHASLAYNRAVYENYQNAICWGGQPTGGTGNEEGFCRSGGALGGLQNLSGQQLPRAPDWTGTIGAVWDSQLPYADLRLSMSVDEAGSSSYNITATNNPYGLQDSYFVTNASLALYSPHEGWKVALIGKNLTDRFYMNVGSEIPLAANPGSVYGIPGNPRTILLEGTYKY